jgi:hypothetical protein
VSKIVGWIAAEAERPEVGAGGFPFGRKPRHELDRPQDGPPVERLAAHQFGAERVETSGQACGRGAFCKPETTKDTKGQEGNRELWQGALDEALEQERVRRIYRGRTVAMLRRYLRHSMECGRLPSILGSEFFRAKVTSYTVVTFEDRVIFAHDMETCLEKLDEFSRQLIGRHILQEHDRWATARLLHCNEKTVRRLTPIALDLLGEILVEVGLLECLEASRENSCQGGQEGEIAASDSEDGKYKS